MVGLGLGVCAWGSATVFLWDYAGDLAHDEGHIFLQHSVPRRHLGNIFVTFFFLCMCLEPHSGTFSSSILLLNYFLSYPIVLEFLIQVHVLNHFRSR